MLDHVYVVVRADVPQPHLSVQAAHAAVAATFAYGDARKSHPNLVLCTVPDEQALLDEFERLKEAGVPVVLWREEDMDGQATALATGPLRGKQRRELCQFALLK